MQKLIVDKCLLPCKRGIARDFVFDFPVTFCVTRNIFLHSICIHINGQCFIMKYCAQSSSIDPANLYLRSCQLLFEQQSV